MTRCIQTPPTLKKKLAEATGLPRESFRVDEGLKILPKTSLIKNQNDVMFSDVFLILERFFSQQRSRYHAKGFARQLLKKQTKKILSLQNKLNPTL